MSHKQNKIIGRYVGQGLVALQDGTLVKVARVRNPYIGDWVRTAHDGTVYCRGTAGKKELCYGD